MLNQHVYLLHPTYLQLQLKGDVLLVAGEPYHQVGHHFYDIFQYFEVKSVGSLN